MPPLVRRARIEDLDQVVRLWREMWDYHVPFDPRFRATAAAETVMAGWIEENMGSPRSAVFVAEEAPGALDGYCLAMILENPPVLPHQFYGYVSEISVRGKRRGVGSELLRAAHAWFREQGLPYAEVNVSVRNAAARAFWRRHGYGDFLERLRTEL
jgi:ribosomal protein S18 acetylase RimI-like enzyme